MSACPPRQYSIYLLATEGATQFSPEELSSIFVNLSDLLRRKARGSDLLQASAVADECGDSPNDKLVKILDHEHSYLNQGHRTEFLWK